MGVKDENILGDVSVPRGKLGNFAPQRAPSPAKKVELVSTIRPPSNASQREGPLWQRTRRVGITNESTSSTASDFHVVPKKSETKAFICKDFNRGRRVSLDEGRAKSLFAFPYENTQHTHTHKHTHKHTHTRSQIHTPTHTHALLRTRTHTHTHTDP